VAAVGRLKTETLVRQQRKNITRFDRCIKPLGLNLTPPKRGTPAIRSWIKIDGTRLFLVVQKTNTSKTHPAFFSIGILPATQKINLFGEG